MQNRPFFFDRQGHPLDAETADRLLGDPVYKRVALTEITSSSDPTVRYRVSTVWLATNHRFGDGPPILFETMVFQSDSMSDEFMERYSTEGQAAAGHAEIVATVAATVPDDIVNDLADWGSS